MLNHPNEKKFSKTTKTVNRMALLYSIFCLQIFYICRILIADLLHLICCNNTFT